MSAHTTGRLRVPVTPNGRAYGLLCAGQGPESDLIDWANHEFKNPVDAQRLAACWNVCRGFDTDLLINIDMMDETLKQRFALIKSENRETVGELDDLRAVMREVYDEREMLRTDLGVLETRYEASMKELGRARGALERLLACEPLLTELSDIDLFAASTDKAAPQLDRDKAMATLQARAALAMIGGANA